MGDFVKLLNWDRYTLASAKGSGCGLADNMEDIIVKKKADATADDERRTTVKGRREFLKGSLVLAGAAAAVAGGGRAGPGGEHIPCGPHLHQGGAGAVGRQGRSPCAEGHGGRKED